MSEHEMPKAYDPKASEDQIYEAWEESGFFNPDHLSGSPFSVMMPPPNVTGVLHLGHALENTLMDTMVRFKRMGGHKVLLLPGTDHAAIATQAKVEKLLKEEGVKYPRELGREKLVERIREYAENSRATILNQIKKMGTSCDWSRLAYTFDEQRNKSVNELFLRMYQDGLVYRGSRAVNWSVKGQSTCSDDELVYVERTAKLYTFKYAKDFPITIASTRPETKLGDTAVAVHPTDERYKKYIGQTFTVDIGAKEALSLRIIADENVDPTFGTGALGVTPAHSSIDFAMYEKQKAIGEPIGLVSVIGTDGRMTEEAGRYAGMTAEEAREAFVSWLRQEGLLEKEEEVTQSVGTSDRYGDVVEVIPLTQWWLDVQKEIPGRGKSLRDLMREALTVGLNNDSKQKIEINPDRFTKLYLDRIENLRDWCLSRQIWWGHRIPVWYRGEEMVVGQEPSGEGWVQDEDTLDTWFSSGSWTFSTLGWPEETKDLKTFHPTSWMQMGYEILYLWLMRMVLMGTYALNQIPFHQVYIHGMLRDKEGRKFSKSLGNGVDPIEVVQTYGADALRFSLIVGITPGNDSRFYEEKVESAQHLVNKIWNISRFVLMSVEDRTNATYQAETLADRWILSRFSVVSSKVTEHLEKYEFSAAGELLRDFTWSEFADWYLEIAKLQKSKNTDAILIHCLETLLKLWHPFMPFVTEKIWNEMGKDKMLIITEWPKVQDQEDASAEAEMMRLQETIVAIRNLRAEYKVEPKLHILASVVSEEQDFYVQQAPVIAALARLSALQFNPLAESGAKIVSSVVAGATVYVEASGTGEKDKTDAMRLQKDLEEVENYLVSLEQKLANKEFVSKAPAQVVEKMKRNLTEAQEKQTALKTQLEALND